MVRLARTYGGRARYSSSEWCLVDPMPPTLSNVAFATGDQPDSPTQVTLGRPFLDASRVHRPDPHLGLQHLWSATGRTRRW